MIKYCEIYYFMLHSHTHLASWRWANIGNGWHGCSGICNVGPTLGTGRKANLVFSTSAQRRIQTSILGAFADIGPMLVNVRKPTVILSTSSHRQLQTSIIRVFDDIGSTLAQGEETNSVFPTTYITDMIVLVLYFSHKNNIIMGTKFTEVSNIVISI